MKNKILFCMFLAALVLVSFVGAEDLIIKSDLNKIDLIDCLDKICLDTISEINITTTNFTLIGEIKNITIISLDPIFLPLPIFIGIPVIPTMHEGDSHVFGVQVYHPDGNPIVIEWYLNGELVSSNEYDSTGLPLGVTDEYNFTAISGVTYNFKVVASNSGISFCYGLPPNTICPPNSNSIEFDVEVIDITPPVISNVESILIGNTRYIRWETNEPSRFNKVEYGRGKKYEYSSSLVLISFNFSDPTINTMFSPLTLDKSGNYHYKVTSCNMFGFCSTSEGYKVKK